MLDAYGFGTLATHSRLFGGYSGSNYLVESTSAERAGTLDSRAVLKVCHGYAPSDVEAQAAVMAHLRSEGFEGACTALPLRSPSLSPLAHRPFAWRAPNGDPCCRFAGRARNGDPCCLLSYISGGVQASSVLEGGKVAAKRVLEAVGDGLGRLHAVRAAPSLRQVEVAGACDLHKQEPFSKNQLFCLLFLNVAPPLLPHVQNLTQKSPQKKSFSLSLPKCRTPTHTHLTKYSLLSLSHDFPHISHLPTSRNRSHILTLNSLTNQLLPSLSLPCFSQMSHLPCSTHVGFFSLVTFTSSSPARSPPHSTGVPGSQSTHSSPSTTHGSPTSASSCAQPLTHLSRAEFCTETHF